MGAQRNNLIVYRGKLRWLIIAGVVDSDAVALLGLASRCISDNHYY